VSEKLSPAEKERRLFLVFKQAIEDERRAQEVYREAMTITDDPVLLKAFRSLLKDEVRHEQEMTEKYNEFKRRYLGPTAE
jgi:rubrerythrin